jgi:DNA topoisomerase I
MAKKLLIVESPSKAKTISKYLGADYSVMASVGHIRDIPKSNKIAIDIEKGFIPFYEISKGKEKVVQEIKKLSKKADEVILATDPDREGEAIAWHIKEAAGLKNPKRIVFNEITKEAIIEALNHPREVDDDLRRAQEARRVLDRLVGYDLSGLIWKKVRYGLSAGRVQSPALRILMEKEREIRAFVPVKFFTITADVKGKVGTPFELVCSVEPKEEKEAQRIVDIGKGGEWKVKDIKETSAKRATRPPFITSTLQQQASSRLGFSPSKTMGVAQKLYEAGLITYMRTDSPSLSSTFIGQIASLVEKKYGKNFVAITHFKTKSKSAQEAHEAIRPTDIFKESAGTTTEQQRLYKLIWQRTVASQMAPADLLRTKIVVSVNDGEVPDFETNGSRVIFAGWLDADKDARGEDVEVPKVSINEILSLLNINKEARETLPPNRYTEAGLIKELEKRGIGRPSTYASIMKTLADRGYVEKVGRSLKPTDTGDVVSTFLEENFAEYISDTFTAEMEDELDEIATGKRDYTKTLRDFYTPFLKEVKSKDKIAKVTNMGDAPSEFPCPICGASMIIKLGKNGKFMSCSTFPACSGARTIEGEIMEGPKEIGEKCPKCEKGELVERSGRFGKFISCARYPKCKFIKVDEEQKLKNSTGVNCPICKKGVMTEKRGRFGVFYGCSNYPDCKHNIKAKPTGKICGYMRENGPCEALMMDGTKTIPERCSDKTCPNHNPHKLNKE